MNHIAFCNISEVSLSYNRTTPGTVPADRRLSSVPPVSHSALQISILLGPRPIILYLQLKAMWESLAAQKISLEVSTKEKVRGPYQRLQRENSKLDRSY
jgi:hypothetical protein